jgi:hypothetical protein
LKSNKEESPGLQHIHYGRILCLHALAEEEALRVKKQNKTSQLRNSITKGNKILPSYNIISSYLTQKKGKIQFDFISLFLVYSKRNQTEKCRHILPAAGRIVCLEGVLGRSAWKVCLEGLPGRRDFDWWYV